MIRQVAHSLTFRLALMFSLCAFVVLFLLGFAVLYTVNQHFISQDRMALETQSNHIIHTLHQSNSLSALQKQMQYLPQSATHDEHGLLIFIIDETNTVLFKNIDISSSIDIPNVVASTENLSLVNWHIETDSYRLLSQSLTVFNKPTTLIVAININHHETFLASFKYSMWLSIAIAALLMGILACMVAKRGLRPLHTLIHQTSLITVENLSQRLPVSQTYSEISQLTQTFNEMLNRLDNSFQRLVGFSSDLAHELRTPLSTMKMQHQVMLSRARSLEEYQQTLQDNAEELEHLIIMVTDMLFLAKSENGLISPDVESFSLDQEIKKLFEFYEYLAQERNIRLNLNGSAYLTGDKTLLRRAMSNLIANALTYGYENSTININITRSEHQTTITIENQGETIAPTHLPHLFERFYRIDSARTHSAEGVGLGLAITAAIIQAHQGKITVSSKNHLTCFTIILS